MSQLYLYAGLKERFTTEINNLATMTKERLLFQFSEAEKEATEYRDELMRQHVCSDDYEKEEEYRINVMDNAYEYYELLSLMNYRTIAMAISLLCQVWEQQLYSFIIHEAFQDGLIGIANNSGASFKFCEKSLAEHGVSIDGLECWKTLNELRLLVNVIKHGEGESETRACSH